MKTTKTAVGAAGILLAAAMGLFAKDAPRAPRKEAGGCSSCREKRPVLPASEIPADDAASQQAYAVARKHPALLDRLHCYCGCEESPQLHHKSLLTCYTTLHATGCEICRGEATMAGRMKDEGSPDDEIKEVVESLYRPH
jgi:hypothetical protein